jgi:hypothetical protein
MENDWLQSALEQSKILLEILRIQVEKEQKSLKSRGKSNG